MLNAKLMEDLIQRADEAGVRLEIVGGLPLWEAHPVLKHQEEVDRIRASIRKSDLGDGQSCGCFHIPDVYILFPEGSLKRPDVSIFCRRPEQEEEAITLIPEAVIEVVSRGYEVKDLEIGPRFYLQQGIKDVIVFDPYTLLVLHARQESASRQVSPVTIELKCGCRCIV
jgi:Uma2 family endonuclease